MAETKSVYKNKKNDPAKKKTTSKRQLKRITKTCIYCGKTQSETMFYKSNNPLHEDGFLPICKDCIKENSYDEDIDAVDMEKLKSILRQVDRPFLPYYYNVSVKEFNKTEAGKNPKHGDCKHIVGLYFKNLSSIPTLRNLTWADGEKMVEDEKNPPVEFVEPKRGKKAEPKGVYKAVSPEFEVTPEILNLFGDGYTKKEYEAMYNKFNFLKVSYPTVTNLHIEALVNYVKLKVKAEMAISKGDLDEAEGWDKLATKAAEKAKINPSQLSQRDMQGGMNSFSELFQEVEKAVDVIPIMPQFKYRPNDSADFIIWCYVNYIRDMEGKPLCDYAEIYKFYDKMKEKYIKQYGDPYGIFKDDNSEENRGRIRDFIQTAEDDADEQ